jgi:glycosyltransferase involved in cell wall biosynthesis
MRSLAALNIAVVEPAGDACPLAEDLVSGLSARGHRVRLYRDAADYQRLFRRLRADAPDVVSQHAGDPEAFALAEGLPVLHTLHVPPTPALIEACTRCRAWFTAPSTFAAQAWQAAGLERIQIISGAVADFPLPSAVVRPLALVADRTGAVAALRAGLGIAMPSLLGVPRKELWRRFAHAAVYVAASEPSAFDWIAAQAQLAGCPVVGYALGALPEIVEDGRSGWLVAPGDQRALAAVARRAATLDRHGVRASARPRLGLERLLDRYESELRAIARRSAVRLVA